MQFTVQFLVQAVFWNLSSMGAKKEVSTEFEESENPQDAKVQRILTFKSTGEAITNFDQLESKLFAIGWHRYTGQLEPMWHFKSDRRQYFTTGPGCYFISLPLAFDKLRIIHLYEIVVQTRTAFEIREIIQHRRKQL